MRHGALLIPLTLFGGEMKCTVLIGLKGNLVD